MENCNNMENQSSCSMCKSKSYKVLVEFKKAIENRQMLQIEHIYSYHLDYKFDKRDDAGTYMHHAFKQSDNVDLTKHQETIIQILKFFLDNELSKVNVKDSTDQTVLHLAVKHRLTRVIDFLIGVGARLNIRDRYGNYILHYFIKTESQKFSQLLQKCQDLGKLEAFEKESIDIVRWILLKTKGFDVNSVTKNGETALHLAAKSTLFYAISFLLDYAVDTSIVDYRNMTALQIFVESVSKFYQKPEFKLFETHWIEICEKFLNKGFSVNLIDNNGCTILHYALNQDRPAMAKLVLKNFTNVNACDKQRNTALHIVINLLKKGKSQSEYHEIAQVLVTKGANVYQTNNDGISPLLVAVLDEKLSLLDIFKENGANLRKSYNGSTLLHLFCKWMNKYHCKDYQKVLNLLIGEGCDINAKDSKGKTPLHYAARYCRIEIVQRLIDCGANLNDIESISGFTPLHEAVSCSSENSALLLIEKGAEINAITKKGRTVLHFIRSKNKNAVEKMIKLGANIDVQDKRGLLPIHIAILHQDIGVMNDLLNFGADINDNAHVLCRNNYNKVYGCLSEHLIKLQVAELPIHNKLYKFLTGKNRFSDIYVKCVEEIEILKSYKINESMSLYDLLHVNKKSTCNYVENEELEELIKLSTFNKKFPIYHILISATYYMGIQRRNMLETAKDALHKLADFIFPELCLYEIFGYLTNVNLRSLIDGADVRR